MYLPNQVLGDLRQFLANELQRLANVLNTPTPDVKLAVSYSQPKKYTEGTIVFADGTSWNPGSGAGFYGYRGGAWRKLD